jgi:superfamily I DNA/RNA helicase
MTLLKRGVRARIRGRDVGAAIVALVRKLAPADIDDLERKVGAWSAREILRAQRKLNEEAAAERISNVLDQAAVVIGIAEDCDTIDAFARRCDELFTDTPGTAAVTLSSVHRAKGLEADTVYLLRDTFREGSVEEDNIRYVAITRAKRRLVWVDGVAA